MADPPTSAVDEIQKGVAVSSFPSSSYSKKDVRRAGEIIAGPLDAEDPNLPYCVEAFGIANSWRDAHAYPMKSIRSQIISYLRTLKIEGITAARLKRMQAIRRKLRREDFDLNLGQLQDLGGCRAILGSIEEVDILVTALRERSRHKVRKENNYIAAPKARDGYRSHHIIFEFLGKGDASSHTDKRIEVQVRTRLQHSWATAVEGVGLFRGEDLKGNKGDTQWLRLFKLMSAEIALAENCLESDDVPSHGDRVKEIKALNDELQALDTLDNLSNAVRWTEDAVQTNDMPMYYLIAYDNLTRVVQVEPHYRPISAVRAYDLAELVDNKSGRNSKNVVLVEAGKVNQLKEAYPNYFGDVQQFRQNLKRVTDGKLAKDYSLILQERIFQSRERKLDPSWLIRRGWWR